MKEFARVFFHYCFKTPVSKQLLCDSKGVPIPKPLFWVRVFEISYGGKWDGLGVAMVAELKGSALEEIKFFMFGDPEVWEKNENDFVAQFANDNS